MKIFALAFAAAIACVAYGNSEDAIMRLLNSKASGSPKSYEVAAQEVATMAKAEKNTPRRAVARIVTAIVSREHGAPKAARIDAQTRDEYIRTSTNLIMRLAKEKNNGLAWYLLSLESEDTNMLRRAAICGNPQALNAWGSLLVTTTLADALPEDETNAALKDALGYFRRAADQNDVNGLYNLGMCLARGLGTEVDAESAFNCFRTAAERGHPEAINNIGYHFHEGIVVPKDVQLAARWYRKSSDLGNAYGMYNYATALMKGDGVERDEAEGARLMKLSADAGCVEAMNAYAEALRDGRGVKSNPREAFLMFRRAAEYGFWPAMENIAGCYDKGIGTAANGQKGMVWRIRSRAARGDRNAQAWLANNPGM